MAIVLASGALAGCGSGEQDERPAGSRAQAPAARIPAPVERDVHETFHRLPRSCSARRADGPVLDRTTARFVRWYRRYPADRYEMRIDDESGTMLSAILVLRYELAGCSPSHAARIDAVLPPRIRRALKPAFGSAAPASGR